MSELVKTSRFLSFVLRHKPEAIGISLDEHGWAKVEELIKGVSKVHFLDMELLEEIVRTDDKQRYSFNEDKTLIRANQGHSIAVDVELERRLPPEFLWHGSAVKYAESIEEKGLILKSRLYVHLSADYDTAVNVGKRHGEPVVYKVFSGEMAREGFAFFLSKNGVWLVKEVPKEFLEKSEK